MEGETESEGERVRAAEGLGETEAVEEVVGVGRCVAEGRAVGELVPSSCTAPARRLPAPAPEVLPEVLSQSAPNWQGRHAVAAGALLYFPAGQRLHTLCPGWSLYVPFGHAFCVALVEPAPHQWPASQGPSQVSTMLPMEEP